jgi:hypothetical protein
MICENPPVIRENRINMVDDKKLNEYIEKVKKMEKGEKLDLSSGEDLSIGIMNLISIEEHLFFSGGKTGKTKYYEMINDIRKMRVDLMKEIIKDYNGEEWCIGKHLLAASMRLMEVGTKALKNEEKDKAYGLFKKSYDLYNMFWGITLGIADKNNLGEVKYDKKDLPIEHKEQDLMGKISGVIGKILDCCRE